MSTEELKAPTYEELRELVPDDITFCQDFIETGVCKNYTCQAFIKKGKCSLMKTPNKSKQKVNKLLRILFGEKFIQRSSK